jgi:squalene-associated FAD-dependent desaturase
MRGRADTVARPVHVIGAGLAGLAAATALAARGRRVILTEGAGQAGGRARSFHEASLGRVIDNGNHLLLSGNGDVMGFLDRIGARDRLTGPTEAAFPFLDLASGRRWTVRIGSGRLPAWLFDADRRVPDTRPLDYVRAALALARAPDHATVAETLGPGGALYDRFWHPLAVSALNTEAETAQARLLWPVLKETFGRGGRACRPLWARDGLSETFVDPALAWLRERGATIRMGRRLRALDVEDGRVVGLSFHDGDEALDPGASVVLALPAWSVNLLLPGLRAPAETRPIVNLHFRLDAPPPADLPQPLGLLGGTAEWLFVRGDMASVTISAAQSLAHLPAEAIARPVWRDVARALGRPPETPQPPVKVIKEKRATFAQTPAQVARRPGPRGALANLILAGDWTDTGLPATLEGAVRSGHRAALSVIALQRET